LLEYQNLKGVYDVKIFTDEFTGSVRKIVKKKALIITASSLVGITAIGIGFRLLLFKKNEKSFQKE